MQQVNLILINNGFFTFSLLKHEIEYDDFRNANFVVDDKIAFQTCYAILYNPFDIFLTK